MSATLSVRAPRIHAKAEHLNKTGSVKDRMAVHIVAACTPRAR